MKHARADYDDLHIRVALVLNQVSVVANRFSGATRI